MAAFAHGTRPGERERPLLQRFSAAAGAAQCPAWTGACFGGVSAEPAPAAGDWMGWRRDEDAPDSPGGGSSSGSGGAGLPVDSLEVLLLQAAALSPLLRRKASDLAARVAQLEPAHPAATPAASDGWGGGRAVPLPSLGDLPPPLEPLRALSVPAAAMAGVFSIERPPSPSDGGVFGDSLPQPEEGRVEAAGGAEERRAAVAAGVGVWGGGVKGAARAMEKLLRSYECCPARLTDVCREVCRGT